MRQMKYQVVHAGIARWGAYTVAPVRSQCNDNPIISSDVSALSRSNRVSVDMIHMIHKMTGSTTGHQAGLIGGSPPKYPMRLIGGDF